LNEIQPSSLEIQKQYDIIYVINYVDSRSSLSIEDENIIGEKLYEINENNPNYPFVSTSESTRSAYGNESFLIEEYNTINEFIFRKIAARYRNSNSFIHLIFSGEVFFDLCVKSASSLENDQSNSTDFEIKVSDINRFIVDLNRTPESKLSLFAATYYFQIPDEISEQNFNRCEQMLKELKATILLRNPAKLDEAISIYNALPADLINENFVNGSPFSYTSKTPNFGHHDEIQEQLPKMSRLAFAKKVKQLIEQPLTAENAFQLGIAYYNSSYYGLQWKLLAYARIYSFPDGNVDMSVAESYLNTALTLGGLTRERQAQAYFMLARCEQNRYSYKNDGFPDWDEGGDGFTAYFDEMKRSGSMRNFQLLASNYYGTATYQEIIRECKYFEYYID
jgi:hypothetical protein